MQDGLGDGQRTAKTGDDAADGGDFYLGGGVADEKNIAVANALLDGNPLFVDGNARALPFERLEIFVFEEAFEAALGVAAVHADDAQRAALGGFGDQPVEIGRVVGDEPDAGGVGGAVFGKADDGLHERHGFNRRPAGSAGDAAGGAVGSHDAGGVQLFLAAGRFGFEAEAAGIGSQAEEAGVERNLRAGLLGSASESGDESGALNDQIGFGEGNLRGAAVGEEFETADFIDDAFAGGRAELIAEMAGDDESARGRIEVGLGFEDANGASTASDGAAVKRPAAEPPTTTTSPFSRDERESLNFFATVWYAPTTRVGLDAIY